MLFCEKFLSNFLKKKKKEKRNVLNAFQSARILFLKNKSYTFFYNIICNTLYNNDEKNKKKMLKY